MRSHCLRSLPLLAALCLPLAACGDDPVEDAGVADSGTPPADGGSDAGVVDSGRADSGTPDAGADDAGTPDAGEVDAGPPDIRVPGLSAPVQVRYDSEGVTHLKCQTDSDCFAAEGYLHASHRFGQMDVRRRFAQGRLAEMFGVPAIADIDVASRTFVATSSGADLAQRLWDHADPQIRAAISAYTRGVNAFLADMRNNNKNGARITLEWAQLSANVQDWNELDCVYVVIALAQSLTDVSDYEIRLGTGYAALPATVALDLFGLRTASPATTLPNPNESRSLDPNVALLAGTREAQGRLLNAFPALASAISNGNGLAPGLDRGSNNWVVAPAQTGNNRGLLANDPHLGMDNPSVWYLVSIDSKTGGATGNVHVAGASLAGFPGIVLGQNEDVAIGGTVSFFDMTDVYVETLNSAGDAVMFNGNEVPIISRNITINVLGAAPRQAIARYVPHHGPIVSYDLANSTAISVRWVGHQADTDLNIFYGLWTATNADQVKAALRNATTTGQNWVVTDRSGNIGWFPYSRVPQRPWATPALAPWLPLPGDGSAEWQGFIPYDELPQLSNPTAGFIATANNDMTGALWDGDPTNDGAPYYQSLVAEGYREERIQARLTAGLGSLDRDEMQSIQGDVRVLIGERTLPHILAMAEASTTLTAAGQEVVDALTAWDFECPTGLVSSDPNSAAVTSAAVLASSAGCSAFHVLWYKLVSATFADELVGTEVMGEHARDEAMVVLLTRPNAFVNGSVYWDDVTTAAMVETSTDTITKAINDTGNQLGTLFTGGAATWQWGRIHRLTLRALLFNDAGVGQYNNGPYANDGGLYTVDVANPGNGFGNFYGQTSGPSMRFACEASTTMSCTIQLPGGQRHFRNSPFLDNLLPGWLSNTSFPLRFSETEIEAATAETVTIQAP